MTDTQAAVAAALMQAAEVVYQFFDALSFDDEWSLEDLQAAVLALITPDQHAALAAHVAAEVAKARAEDAWQPIETAPSGVARDGKKSMVWMLLVWPDGEGGYHSASGMRVGDQFFAAATFYTGGPFDGKQFTMKEVEVKPTHWKPCLTPPVAQIGAKP